MKKINLFKKFLISLCAVCFVGACGSAVLGANAMVKAANATPKITMVSGAYVRNAEPNGIRFVANLNKDMMDSISTENALKENVAVGMFIVPYAYAEDYLKESDKAVNFYEYCKNVKGKLIDFNYTYDQIVKHEDGSFEIRGSIVNINFNNLNLKFSAVGYVKNGENYTFTNTNAVPKEVNARSIADLAVKALNQNAEDKSGFLKDTQKLARYNEMGVKLVGDKYVYNGTEYVTLEEITADPFENFTVDTAEKIVNVNDSFNVVVNDKFGGEVVWSTSDESIAKVNGGAVTAVAPGHAVITARKGAITKTCNVIVKPNNEILDLGGLLSVNSFESIAGGEGLMAVSENVKFDNNNTIELDFKGLTGERQLVHDLSYFPAGKEVFFFVYNTGNCDVTIGLNWVGNLGQKVLKNKWSCIKFPTDSLNINGNKVITFTGENNQPMDKIYMSSWYGDFIVPLEMDLTPDASDLTIGGQPGIKQVTATEIDGKNAYTLTTTANVWGELVLNRYKADPGRNYHDIVEFDVQNLTTHEIKIYFNWSKDPIAVVGPTTKWVHVTIDVALFDVDSIALQILSATDGAFKFDGNINITHITARRQEAEYINNLRYEAGFSGSVVLSTEQMFMNRPSLKITNDKDDASPRDILFDCMDLASKGYKTAVIYVYHTNKFNMSIQFTWDAEKYINPNTWTEVVIPIERLGVTDKAVTDKVLANPCITMCNRGDNGWSPVPFDGDVYLSPVFLYR